MALALLLLIAAPTDTFTGKVTAITDVDSIKVQNQSIIPVASLLIWVTVFRSVHTLNSLYDAGRRPSNKRPK